ncbi:dTTP/UTP pyrophosphatase-like [Bolinopsis microptera]|uniref:dTTP/UTP pyrophosphatase-like n=1 Tax=Bolinopsis microptera TaxID=2820187 RepID=UPI003078E8AB
MTEHSLFGNYRIILASTSPRRIELIKQIGIKAEIIPSDFEENLPKSSFPTPADYVIATAEGKACKVFSENTDAVVIGADTVVVIDNKILEKPSDAQCAHTMLSRLSGRIHHLVTGVCICYQDIKHTFHVQTEVKLIDLSPDLIDWYIGTGEPFDKAGGYGTRGKGAILVDRIAGCPFSMMGLPLQKLHSELSRILG